MKLVNRYHLWASLECQAFTKAEAVLKFSTEEDGMWVQYEDYARLKAEVERLRKAGDAMAKVIDDDYLNTLQVWIDWNAAKEGKPSA